MKSSQDLPDAVDVLVIGAGNAAMCAALAARESGVSVALLERAPADESGGNSRFTAGAIRCVYDGVDDLRELMPDLSDQEIANTDFGTYTEEQFFDDIGRITQYRCDPDLAETLIRNSRVTMRWMRARPCCDSTCERSTPPRLTNMIERRRVSWPNEKICGNSFVP